MKIFSNTIQIIQKQVSNILQNKLLNDTFWQLMFVNILIGLVQPLNQFVDSVLTGKFLGISAMNAYALFIPVGSCFVALSLFFAIGTQICCSKSIGKGNFDDIKTISSTAYRTVLIFSLLLVAIFIFLPDKLALLLGANIKISGQINATASYLFGYAVGIPAIFLMQIMLPLMQIEGRKSLATMSMVVVFIVNIVGDLLNLFVFKGGLFGMAFATSISNIAGFLIVFVYLLFFTRMFNFTLNKFSFEELKRICKHGFPSLSYYGSIVGRTAFFNFLILTQLENDIMAVMVVVNSFTTLIDSAIGGTGDAVLLLGGVLNGESNQAGQRNLLKISFLYGGLLHFLLMILTFFAATPIAVMFSNDSSQEFISSVTRALQITALYFLPDVFSCILKKYVQSVGRSLYTSISNILCNLVYICIAAFILVRYMGSDGLFLSYTVSYICILVTHFLYAWCVSENKSFFRFDNLLFISQKDIISDENTAEYYIYNFDDCTKVAKDVLNFCLNRKINKKTSNYLSLITEEVTTNIVKHGFKGRKQDIIIIRVVLIENKVNLNIKDTCRYFDPLRFYEKLKDSKDPTSGIGIKIIVGISDNVTYNNSFNLNNLKIEMHTN